MARFMLEKTLDGLRVDVPTHVDRLGVADAVVGDVALANL
jgi:hypothetical protein